LNNIVLFEEEEIYLVAWLINGGQSKISANCQHNGDENVKRENKNEQLVLKIKWAKKVKRRIKVSKIMLPAGLRACHRFSTLHPHKADASPVISSKYSLHAPWFAISCCCFFDMFCILVNKVDKKMF